jgi:2-polyprenyl-6-methoxyphenol hydroxylase-like FAD-dependent oxidoreductase
MVTEHGIFYREAEECRVWGKGPISLLGDAAHLSTPMLGQGLNQALEDAAELGRAIGKYGATENALREYERVRLPRSQRVQAASVAMMKSFVSGGEADEQKWHFENPWCQQHKSEPLQVVQMVKCAGWGLVVGDCTSGLVTRLCMNVVEPM